MLKPGGHEYEGQLTETPKLQVTRATGFAEHLAETTGLRISGATGFAEQLLMERGDLGGHPAWMGVGVNQMYSDEMVMAHIELARQLRVGTFWVVLAHEVAAENKVALKKPAFHELKASIRKGVARFLISTEFGERSIEMFAKEDSLCEKTPERAKYLAQIDTYKELARKKQEGLRTNIWEKYGIKSLGRVMVVTQEEAYEHMLRQREPTIIHNKNLLLEALIQNPQFQADMNELFEKVVPGFWERIQKGEVYMPSAYRYTIEQIFLTYALLRYCNIGIKFGPETEQGPDAIFQNFLAGKYRIRPEDLPLSQQGCIYTSNT